MSQDVTGIDVECIIVDDCGQDESMAIVRQTIAGYQGPVSFRIVAHEKNRGLSAARNTGVEHAVGDFVLFIDSDDWLMPDSIQYLWSHHQQHPKADMVMGNVKNCKGGDLQIHNIQEPQLFDDPNVFFRRMLHHQIYLYAWNKLIRRSLLIQHDIRFVEGILYEDQSWSYQLFSCLSAVLLLPRVTYVYENNPASIVNTTLTKEKADEVIRSYTISTNLMLNNPPDSTRYHRNMTVDYMLFMVNFLMNGVDLLLAHQISPAVARDFLHVRHRMLFRAMRYGRLLLAVFFLLLFWPFCLIQKLRLFRHQYYNIESVVNILAHKTDFLHHK